MSKTSGPTPLPLTAMVIPTITREQMEAVQAWVFDLVPAEDRQVVLAALFQPPRDVRVDENGKRVYGRDR